MKNLIQQLINEGYLKTKRITDAFEKINRTDFVPEKIKYDADLNIALPIGYGQTISQPLTVAFMLELLQPEQGNKIMDIGSGSGWQTAMLAEIVGNKGKVYAIERIPELKDFGENNVKQYNFVSKGIVKFLCQDGSLGIPKEAPFDRIIAAAAAKKIPEALLEQLKIGGRLVLPVEEPDGLQNIMLIEKLNKDKFKKSIFPGFVFVPFVEE